MGKAAAATQTARPAAARKGKGGQHRDHPDSPDDLGGRRGQGRARPDRTQRGADGNTRTALAACLVFLVANGHLNGAARRFTARFVLIAVQHK